MKKSISLRCECSGEMLVLDKDEEDDSIYVSIWTYGTDCIKLGFKDRIRYCFQILFKGRPYGDEMILSKDKSKELKEYLEKI